MKFDRSSARQVGMKLSHGDRSRNDDYFPQGEEYEDEIGMDKHQMGYNRGKQSTTQDDEEHDNFQPTMLMFHDKKNVIRDPLTRFITYVYSPIEPDRQTMLMSNTISDKDAIEKLQTLIEKATEFKRRVFRSKTDTKSDPPTEVKEKTVRKDETSNSKTTNESSFQSQEEILTSAR